MKLPHLLLLLLPLLLRRAGAETDSSTISSAKQEKTTSPFVSSNLPSLKERLIAPRRGVADDHVTDKTPDNANLLHNTGLWNASKLLSRNATYQHMTISTDKYINFSRRTLAVNRTDLCNNTYKRSRDSGKPLVSQIDEYLISTHVEGENKSSDKVMFKVMSQVREGDAGTGTNSSATEVKQTIKSSLGSVAVAVSSLAGMEARPAPGPPRNRTGARLRAGRTDAPMLNYIFDTYSTLNKHSHRNDRFGGPRIESSSGVVSVDTEAEAHLDCRVAALQDKLVSWVRRKPEDGSLEILTIGQQTFTADVRFSVEFLVPDTWRLLLKAARPADSGNYECQLSTHPPLISRHQLLVHPPIVELVESSGTVEQDKYYERNSTLVLGCRVRHLPAAAVTWRHQERILNDDTLRGGVSVRTEEAGGGADSTLLVARLTAADSGRYSCAATTRIPAAGHQLQAGVNVHVLNEESLAELHQGSSSGGPLAPGIFWTLLAPFSIHLLAPLLSFRWEANHNILPL